MDRRRSWAGIRTLAIDGSFDCAMEFFSQNAPNKNDLLPIVAIMNSLSRRGSKHRLRCDIFKGEPRKFFFYEVVKLHSQKVAVPA